VVALAGFCCSMSVGALPETGQNRVRVSKYLVRQKTFLTLN